MQSKRFAALHKAGLMLSRQFRPHEDEAKPGRAFDLQRRLNYRIVRRNLREAFKEKKVEAVEITPQELEWRKNEIVNGNRDAQDLLVANEYCVIMDTKTLGSILLKYYKKSQDKDKGLAENLQGLDFDDPDSFRRFLLRENDVLRGTVVFGEGLVSTVRDMLKEYGQVVCYRDEEGWLNQEDDKVRDHQEPVINLRGKKIRSEAIEPKDRAKVDNSLITYIVAKITNSLKSKKHRTQQWVVETSSQELQFKDEVAFWEDMMGIWVHWGYKLGAKISKLPEDDQNELFRRLFMIQRAQYQIVYGIPNDSEDFKYRGYFYNQP
jgi:hypothetical protein